MLYLSFLCILSLVLSVYSSPLALRDVWSPPITSPTNGTVWTVGAKQTVSWDPTNPPKQITNPKGTIYLGYEANDSLNLDIDHPLADDFELADGKITITVPDVPARTNYIIVLLGNSNNKSPQFRIIPSSSPSQIPSITEPIPITGPNVSLPSEVPDTPSASASVPAEPSVPPQPSPAPNPSSPGQPSPPAPSPTTPLNPSSNPTSPNSAPEPSQSGNAAVSDQAVARGGVVVGSLLTLFMLL